MGQIDRLIQQARGSGPTAKMAIESVAAWRRQIVNAILAAEDDRESLAWAIPKVELLIKSPMPWIPSAEDYALSERLFELWSTPATPSARTIMAGMALAPAHQLPAPPALAAVPGWLRPQYARFLLAAPNIFLHPGEAGRFAAHQMRSMARIHEAILRDHLQDALELADAVAKATCMMVYFNEQNLRDYFRTRAEVLEWLLAKQGHVLAFSAGLASHAVPRIGVLHSAKMQTEALYLLAHLENRPRAAMEVILYSYQSDAEKILSESSRWADRVVALPEDVAASVARIREDDLDLILVSNNIVYGMTPLASIAAHRLARVQVAGGASPVTTGFSSFDLYLSGELNERKNSAQEQYEERLALLDGAVTYYAFAHDRDRASISCSREDLGLRADQIVFFSAANYFKIIPETFRVWAEILAREPKSVLLLMPFNPNWGSDYPRILFRLRLSRELLRFGVATNRVVVANNVQTRADLHKVMSLVDIYLDSFPFSGACSLVDPLQVCVPTVARDGKTFRTGVAAAVLNAQGLGDLLSPDSDAYIERAVALARDPTLRDLERNRIRQATSPLPECIRTEVFARKFTSFCISAVDACRARVETLRAAKPEALCAAAVSLAAELAPVQETEFRRLNDIRIITELIVPYMKTMRTESQNKGHVIDIGACVGQTALPFLKAGFNVDMFEPDPECAEPLSGLCRQYEGYAAHHKEAVVCGSSGTANFRKRNLGLSGLGDSPFGAAQLELRVRTRSAGDIWAERTDAVEFIKIDAEGFDLEILDAFDFSKCLPRLVMIEFGMHFAKHTPAAIRQTYARMERAGYMAAVFETRKLSGFGVTHWACDLADLYFSPTMPGDSGDGMGNMVFFRKDDTLFPALLVVLLESFLPARRRPTFRTGDTDSPWWPKIRI